MCCKKRENECTDLAFETQTYNMQVVKTSLKTPSIPKHRELLHTRIKYAAMEREIEAIKREADYAVCNLIERSMA